MRDPEIQNRELAMRRHRRRVAHGRSPAEQSQISERLNRSAMQSIHSDPTAYQAFLARNYHKRRANAVRRLQQKLLLK